MYLLESSTILTKLHIYVYRVLKKLRADNFRVISLHQNEQFKMQIKKTYCDLKILLSHAININS